MKVIWEMSDNMFRLLRHFSLTSGVAIIAVTALLAFIFRQHEVNQLVELTEIHNISLARTFANTLWPRYSSYIASVAGKDGVALRARRETREIHESLKALTAGLSVYKVKIYDVHGLTAYSSEIDQIGEDYSANRGFVTALREGKPSSKLTHKGKFSAFSGELFDRDIVESYVPIRSRDGQVVAVFELYSDVTGRLGGISQAVNKLLAGLLLVFSLLYAVLFLVVRRADKILNRQYVELQSSENRIRQARDQLELRVDERTRELQESRDRLRLITDSMPALIAYIDAEERYRFANSHYPLWFGADPAEVLGKRVQDVIGEEMYGRVRESTREALSGKPVNYDEFHVLPNGRKVHFHAILTPHVDGWGKVLGYFLLVQDITERKRTEEALQESENRFRGMFENSGIGTAMIDKDGHYLMVNQALCELFGRSKQDLLGMTSLDFTHPDDREASKRRIRNFWRGDTDYYSVEKRYLLNDGQIIWGVANLSLIRDATRNSLYSILQIQDITERKRAEEELIEQQMILAQVTRLSTMGEMAVGLAHELNQPLTAITNYAKGTLHRLRSGEGDPEELLPVMELVADQALRAGGIIRELRQFVGQRELTKSPVDVNLAISNAVTLLAGEVHLGGVKVALDLPERLPEVEVAVIQIQQVIINLARNAMEAMADHGSDSRQVMIRTAQAEGDNIEVTVADTGPGIAPDAVERMYDAFFTTKAEGMGMGLTVSNSIVKAHGGRLWAISDSGTGATFHFTVPVSKGGHR